MKLGVQEKVFELISEQTGLLKEKVTLNSTFKDLEIDSVGLVELVFSIEEFFGINIPFEELEEEELKKKFSSVESLIAELTKLVKEKDK